MRRIIRLVRAPIAKVADKRTWKDVIPARDDAFLQSFEVFKNYVAVNERSGGLMKLRVRSWNGKRDYVISFRGAFLHHPVDADPRNRVDQSPLHLYVADHAKNDL